MEFPKQYIPENEKTEEWHKQCLEAILNSARATSNSMFATERKKDYENYQIINGQFDPKQFEYLTDMYGMTAPARFVNYPLILPKVDALVGEFVSQPLNFDVEVINKDAINRKIEKKVAIAAEVLLRPIRKEIEKVINMEFPPEEMGEEIPEDIDTFMKTPIRLSVESAVTNALEYLMAKHDYKSIFKRGLYDILITGKEFYYVHEKNGDPFIERIDPRAMVWEIDADSESLSDCSKAAYETYMSVNEILDIYGTELTKEQVIELEKIQQEPNEYLRGNAGYTTYYRYTEGDKSLKVRVAIGQWKSIMALDHKVSENKYDPENPYYKLVPDNYKPKKGEKIVKKAVTDVRRATLIGHNILVRWGRKPNQIRHESNYADTKLDFFGVIKNNFNGTTLSLVDAAKNIQIMYNIVMHHIDLSMARAGGKSVVYDTSQKPKNIPLEDVFYHAKNSGLILINSKQEGAMGSRFNQFQQIDFTLSNSVQQMINLKIMLEETMEQLMGISRQRMGVTKTQDAVGNVQQSIVQSNLVTAPYFDLHSKIIGDVLNCVANKLRLVWGNEERVATFLGDTGFKTLQISEEILDEIGVFVKNSSKEIQNKQIMLSMVERAISAGQVDLGMLAKAVNASTGSEVEVILEKGMEALRQSQQQMQERGVAAQEQANQIEAQKIMVPVEVAKINYEREIKVAEISAQAKLGVTERSSENREDLAEAERKAMLDKEFMRASSEVDTQTTKPIK